MTFGLSDQQYQIFEKILIAKLKSYDAKVFIFGSRARGKHHPFSDIDVFYIESPNRTVPSQEISKIKEALEESALAVKVDLVKYADLAKSYLPSIQKDQIEVVLRG